MSASARVAAALVALAYGSVLALARLRRRRAGPAWAPRGGILVTGTFHNPGWFLSHLRPLARSGAGPVVVVTHDAQPEVEGVEVARPPRWLRVLLGRALSKLAWMIVLSTRRRPDLYMGYHILPNAALALVAARLFRRPACYQMTGGPVELIGGGSTAGNPVLATVGGGSPRLERLALAVAGEFDLVVVRGAGGARFLAERGVRAPVAIVPGSVDAARFRPGADRAVDLAFVGRLVEGKQPLEFVEIAAGVARARGSVRAVLLGDGPLRAEVERRVATLGLGGQVEVAGQVDDVGAVLARARVFVLPSLSEGLSIALAEAMTAGAVPLAARVGDLADLVADGVNGYLLRPDDRDGFTRRAEALLGDRALWARMSEAASASARAHMGLPHVASLWARHLRDTMRSAGAAVEGPAFSEQRRRA